MRSLRDRPASVEATVGDEIAIGQAGRRPRPLPPRSSPGAQLGLAGDRSDRAQQHVDLEPSRPASTSAATWPSPRCSRSTVSASQSCWWGSGGASTEDQAAARARPAIGQRSAAVRAERGELDHVRAVDGLAEDAGRRTRSTESNRVASTVSGEASPHASGSARATIGGAKL
jgi:hypothetical protein